LCNARHHQRSHHRSVLAKIAQPFMAGPSSNKINQVPSGTKEPGYFQKNANSVRPKKLADNTAGKE
jgi:hypothetical protein